MTYRAEETGHFTLDNLPDGLGPFTGSLVEPSTWDAINDGITTYVLDTLEKYDAEARKHLAALEHVFEASRQTLRDLRTPIVATPGGGGPDRPGGPDGPGGPDFEFPDPPKFEFPDPPKFEFPDPPKLDFGPPPDLGGGGPDLGGGPDIPGFGGPDIPGPGGGPGPSLPDGAFPAGGLPEFGGSGDPGNPFGPGGESGGPFMGGSAPPLFGPPFPGTTFPTGTGRDQPGNPSLVDGNGNPVNPGNLQLPDGPDFQPGPGTDIPPPGSPEFPAGGTGPGIDLPSGGGPNLPAGSGEPDGPGGLGDFPGGGLADAVGGDPVMGGSGGEGWADWTGLPGDGRPGGGQDGDLMAGRGFGPGGLPMMPPPMMPPMMPGNQKDRERQTWLSEDDTVWGTASAAGTGVIGLPADLAKEIDEQLAPTHVHVRSVAPRAKAGGQQHQEQESTQDDARQQANS